MIQGAMAGYMNCLLQLQKNAPSSLLYRVGWPQDPQNLLFDCQNNIFFPLLITENSFESSNPKIYLKSIKSKK